MEKQSFAGTYQEVKEYQYSAEEKILYPLLEQMLETDYGIIDIYKILYIPAFGSGGRSVPHAVRIYAPFQEYRKSFDIADRVRHCPREGEIVYNWIKEHNLQSFFTDNRRPMIQFGDIERLALEACYTDAFADIAAFKKRIFNPATMKELYAGFMFIVYKSRELLEEAEKSGEQERLRREYCAVLKPYDEMDLITPHRHLDIAFFARRPRRNIPC